MPINGRSAISPPAQFGFFIACAAAGLLVIWPLTSRYKAGCGGPPSPVRCDYERIFREDPRALFRSDQETYFDFEDRGATLELSQVRRRVAPGGRAYVLIDKSSCRVCEVSYTQ